VIFALYTVSTAVVTCFGVITIPYVDAVYVAAYSILMLNTSLHNDNMKEADRMTPEQFLKIVRSAERAKRCVVRGFPIHSSGPNGIQRGFSRNIVHGIQCGVLWKTLQSYGAQWGFSDGFKFVFEVVMHTRVFTVPIFAVFFSIMFVSRFLLRTEQGRRRCTVDGHLPHYQG